MEEVFATSIQFSSQTVQNLESLSSQGSLVWLEDFVAHGENSKNRITTCNWKLELTKAVGALQGTDVEDSLPPRPSRIIGRGRQKSFVVGLNFIGLCRHLLRFVDPTEPSLSSWPRKSAFLVFGIKLTSCLKSDGRRHCECQQ